jgi:hypothetical protein
MWNDMENFSFLFTIQLTFFCIFPIFSLFSSIFSKSVHNWTYFSSIISISFHWKYRRKASWIVKRYGKYGWKFKMWNDMEIMEEK